MKIVMLLLAILIGLPIGAIVANRAPLFTEPGLMVRLKIYLSGNHAVTAEDHAFPELRTRSFALSEADATELTEAVARELRWTRVADSPDFHFVVTTPLMRFKDDVRLELEPREGEVLLHISSSSRVGRADFAANAAHIVRFTEAFTRRVSN